jgi:uncharacterized protein YkwD
MVCTALIRPADATALVPDRATGLAAYRLVQQNVRVATGWTGSTGSCVRGLESPPSLAATSQTVNLLRAAAGLGPVVFDDDLNRKALSAALMMRAASRLSHAPDPMWPCYTSDGAEGASDANLYLGRSGAAAIVGYVEDTGVPSLGHRRWILDPRATVFGSGSTGSTNALIVIGGPDAPTPPGLAVSWPPAGWVPWQWIPDEWSLAIGAPGQSVFFANPRVLVTIDGFPAAARDLRILPPGYGSGTTIGWKVDLHRDLMSEDHTIYVQVEGVVVDNAPYVPAWAVQVFQPEPPPRFVAEPRIKRPNGPGSRVRPGQRLRASASVRGGEITRYRWLRSGGIIADAFGASYTVRRRDRGKTLAVRVTATAPSDGPSTTRTSPRLHVRS